MFIMYVLLLLMILLLVAAIVYVGLRAIRWLRTMFDFRRTYVLWTVLVLLPLLFVVGDFLPASGFARAVTLTGGVSIGLFLYALLFTAAADLLALLLRLTPLSRRPAFRSRKTLRAVGCAVLALSVCVSVYGVVNAATIDRTTYSVSFENGDDDGMRIALISDLHLGSEIGSAQMRRVVEEVNACEADIVVIAGDVFNAEVEDCCDLDETAAELRRIKSRLGVYAVLGNHDPSPEYPPLQAFFESAGIRLLNDETVAFSGFTLVGRAESAPIHGDVSEGRKSLAELLAGADRSNPVIVIDHRPAGVDEAVAFGGFDHVRPYASRPDFPRQSDRRLDPWRRPQLRPYRGGEHRRDRHQRRRLLGTADADRQRRRGCADTNRFAGLNCLKSESAPRNSERFLRLRANL